MLKLKNISLTTMQNLKNSSSNFFLSTHASLDLQNCIKLQLSFFFAHVLYPLFRALTVERTHSNHYARRSLIHIQPLVAIAGQCSVPGTTPGQARLGRLESPTSATSPQLYSQSFAHSFNGGGVGFAIVKRDTARRSSSAEKQAPTELTNS